MARPIPEFNREQTIAVLNRLTVLISMSIVDEAMDGMFGFEEELEAIAHIDALRVYINRSTA